MKHIKNFFQKIIDIVIDDSKRYDFQLKWIYIILAVVAFIMSIVNIFTSKFILLISTAVFSFLCVTNALLQTFSNKKAKLIAKHMFIVEIFALFIFFIITGSPEGFSAIWICLLPTCGLLLFGQKTGTILSGVMLIVLLFFYWTPIGKSLLQYRYTDSFMLRFPMLYVAFSAVSEFLELIRSKTQESLKKTREEYQFFSTHDYLTKVNNRFGFQTLVEKRIDKVGISGFILMIADIDHFKLINDKYGHIAGDEILVQLADKLVELTENKGAVARWGGEEFAIIIDNEENGAEVAENVRRTIEAMTVKTASNTEEISFTVSIGVSSVKKGDTVDLSQLLLNTDRRLYQAKANGRNCVVSE